MPNIDITKILKAKNLIEVTAKHWHRGPACTSGHHNSSCAGFGRETKCTESWVTVNMEKISLGCTCEHHVGPDHPLVFDEKG